MSCDLFHYLFEFLFPFLDEVMLKDTSLSFLILSLIIRLNDCLLFPFDCHHLSSLVVVVVVVVFFFFPDLIGLSRV